MWRAWLRRCLPARGPRRRAASTRSTRRSTWTAAPGAGRPERRRFGGRGSNNKTGTLTATSLTGLELEAGISYANLDALNIWLGFGNNVFTINGTHPTTATTLYTAQGTDTVNINDAGGLLTVNGEQGADIFNVRATSLGSKVRLNGQEDDDTFNLSDRRTCAARGYDVGQGQLDRRIGRAGRRCRVRRHQRRRLGEHGEQGRHADVEHAARARDARRRELLQRWKTSTCGSARAPTACTSTARTPGRPTCSRATATAP